MFKAPGSYRQVEFQDVLEKWKSNDYPLGIYIHNPFCKSLCRYCVNQGTLYNQEDYERYYDRYLPAMIEAYREIIENSTLESWFLGGGTPSLLDEDRLRRLLSSLPRISEGEKTIEIHPAYWSRGQLDILAEYGFHNIIIGVQSFDKDTLKGQNRVHVSEDEVSRLVRNIQERNMYACVDLIGFLNEQESDRYILREDLEKCYQMQADQISPQTKFGQKAEHDRLMLRELISSKFFKCDSYVSDPERIQGYSPEKIKNLDFLAKMYAGMKSFRFYKRDMVRKGFYGPKVTDRMEPAISITQDTHKKATLGIGSYKNRKCNTYSTLNAGGTETELVEINYNWEPEFYIAFERDFYRELEAKIQKVKELGEPPAGVKIEIYKDFRIFNQDTTYREYSIVDLKAQDVNKEHTHKCGCGKCQEKIEYIKQLNKLMEK